MRPDVVFTRCMKCITLAFLFAACGDRLDSLEGKPAPVTCFPALTDCRGEGAARTCKQGQVCIPVPAPAAAECLPYDLCVLGPDDAGVPRVGECDPSGSRCVARNFWGSP